MAGERRTLQRKKKEIILQEKSANTSYHFSNTKEQGTYSVYYYQKLYKSTWQRISAHFSRATQQTIV